MATSQCPLNYKMKEIDIKVPNIGDFTDVEVIEVLVNEGQDILKNDPLITIESDKSSVEIPSNFEGKVKSLKLKVGDKVSEGDLILILESLSSEGKIKEETKIEKQSEPIVEIKQATEQISISEKKIKDGIDVIAIMTPPGSHQEIAELFIKNNIHVISDKPFAGSLAQAKNFIKQLKIIKKSFMGLHIIIRPTQW